mgnify:CR=1 FL=1
MSSTTDPAPPDDDGAATAASPGGWRGRLGKLALILLAAGVVVAGVAFGWLLRGWVPSGGVGETTVVVKRPVIVEPSAVSTGSLPNVLGLGLDEARQAYADAGVEATWIVPKRVPYVAEEGSVVKQEPAAASPIPKKKRDLNLLIATPATMPNLVGVGADDARAKLAEIGVGVTTVVRYESSVDPGQVARTRPAPGEPATPRATIVVSEAPSSVNLADLQATDAGCSQDDPVTLQCDVSQGSVENVYDINDRVSAFTGTIALGADAPAGAAVEFRVLSDDKVLETFPVSDTPRDVRVSIPGGKRLTLQFRRTDSGTDSVSATITDGQLRGARSGIDALTNGSSP